MSVWFDFFEMGAWMNGWWLVIGGGMLDQGLPNHILNHPYRRDAARAHTLGGFLKDFFRKFSGSPNGKYAILMDIVKYEVVHMKI